MDERLKAFYDAYKQSGLINTTDFNTFASADDETKRVFYDAGVQNGLFNTTDYETFASAFPVKKKTMLQPIHWIYHPLRLLRYRSRSPHRRVKLRYRLSKVLALSRSSN